MNQSVIKLIVIYKAAIRLLFSGLETHPSKGLKSVLALITLVTKIYIVNKGTQCTIIALHYLASAYKMKG